MAKTALIQGLSGSGKSQSIFPMPDIGIEGLKPEETVVINILKKELPVRHADKLYRPLKSVTGKDPKTWGNLLNLQDPEQIVGAIQRISAAMPHIKSIVIDDMQYLFGGMYMDKINEKGYDKWDAIGNNGGYIFNWLAQKKDSLRDDLYIFCLTHTSEGEMGSSGVLHIKTKTLGKLVDDKLNIEGLFTVIIHALKRKKRKNEPMSYMFKTKPEMEHDVTKTPVGMFDEELIPNDLGLVRKSMVEYYG